MRHKNHFVQWTLLYAKAIFSFSARLPASDFFADKMYYLTACLNIFLMTGVNKMTKAAAAPQTVFQGLSKNEVIASRQQHGSNALVKQKRTTFLKQFFENFNDPIIKILLIVLMINVVFLFQRFEWYESAGIAVAIFLATFVSTLSEYGSESAFERLQQETETIKCRVERLEGIAEIPINDVVAGDYVLLQAGERIPADGIIISGSLHVDQSALNGESKEAEKFPTADAPNTRDAGGFLLKNRLFRGSIVCSGEGVLLVTGVGGATFYGTIARDVQDRTRQSPLKLRLQTLAGKISLFGYLGAATVAAADLFNSIVMDQGFDPARMAALIKTPSSLVAVVLHAVTLAITVIVVAVPEGLPMMITVVLSSNMKRMLKDNVLVRKLVGIETSGSLNILFTDKTGTITKGKLQVSSFTDGSGKKYNSMPELKKCPGLCRLFELSAFYNTSAAIGSEDKKHAVGGNATERALFDFALDGGAPQKNVRVLSRLPFNSQNKFSLAEIMAGGSSLTLIKGAPEKILPRCAQYYDETGARRPLSGTALSAQTDAMASKAVRLLALAAGSGQINPVGGVKDLTLIGIIGIRDGLRREAAGAIRQITNAGIQIVMITGDNRETAAAVACEAGLMRENQPQAVMTGSELGALSDVQVKKLLPRLRVVARALPSDKSRLITLSQEMGLVAGMTGDGVNDAPALKKADVGFAMGSGMEIAKQAGDIVILDDNIQSIAKAVLYGRTIFKSIRKFIIFQLTVNLCAMTVSIVGPFIGVDTPVTVLQMLWINMVMDTLAGLAFSGEVPLKEYMNEPPKKRDEPIMNRYMWNQILFTGSYTSVLCLLFLKLPAIRQFFRLSENNAYLMSAFFGFFIFASIFNSFNARTNRLNLLAYIWRNRSFVIIISLIATVQLMLIYFGGSLFRTIGLSAAELQTVLLLAFTVVPCDLFRKILLRINGHKGTV